MWRECGPLERLYEGYDQEMNKVLLIKSLDEKFYGYIEDPENKCEYDKLHIRGQVLKKEDLEFIFDMPEIIRNKFEE